LTYWELGQSMEYC